MVHLLWGPLGDGPDPWSPPTFSTCMCEGFHHVVTYCSQFSVVSHHIEFITWLTSFEIIFVVHQCKNDWAQVVIQDSICGLYVLAHLNHSFFGHQLSGYDSRIGGSCMHLLWWWGSPYQQFGCLDWDLMQLRARTNCATLKECGLWFIWICGSWSINLDRPIWSHFGLVLYFLVTGPIRILVQPTCLLCVDHLKICGGSQWAPAGQHQDFHFLFAH